MILFPGIVSERFSISPLSYSARRLQEGCHFLLRPFAGGFAGSGENLGRAGTPFRGARRLRGEILHLRGNDCKAFAGIAGARRLDRVRLMRGDRLGCDFVMKVTMPIRCVASARSCIRALVSVALLTASPSSRVSWAGHLTRTQDNIDRLTLGEGGRLTDRRTLQLVVPAAGMPSKGREREETESEKSRPSDARAAE